MLCEGIKMKVFLSYGHDEYESLAKKIKRDLEEEGFEVWIDKENIRGTSDWENAIEAGIHSSDWIVLLMTEHSVRRPDGVCLDEISYARFLGKNIAPIMVQDVKPPLCIARIQWIDMKNFIIPGKAYFDEESYLKRKDELLAILHGLQKINYESEQISLSQKLNPLDNDVYSEFFRKEFYGRKKLIEKYDTWFNSEKRILWLRGDAGTGKTSFIAHLSNIKEEIQAVHFCRYNDNERANPKRAIMSLAYYMSTQLADYREELFKLLDLDKLIEKSTNRLFEYLIIEPLQKIKYHGQPMVIVIDALDEATFNGKNELADIIAFHFLKTPNWLKLIVTSRNEALLKRKLSKFYSIDISNNSKENLDDISGYLSLYLRDILPDGKRQKYILDIITQKSEGIFLYAKTVSDEIRKGNLSIDNVNKFPNGLTGIYLNYFNRIFENNLSFTYKKDIRPVMEILCTTYAPITPNDLCEILDIDEYDIDDILELIQEMFPIKNGFIEPLHKSIIDWLITPQNSGEYRVSAKKGHKRIAAFLKNHASKTWEDYSTKHLCKHLLASGDFQDAIACLNNSDLQHKRIFLVGQDTALRDYFFEIKALYCESFDYACSVFSTDPFISLFAMRRKFLYNSGLYFDLKECGFSDFLKTKSANWDINAEIGISYYYYITEDFNKTIDLVSTILSNKDYEEIMDYVMKEELLNLIGLCYRKHVDFVKSKENFMSAYKIGSEHNESYYLSTSLINLGKISYHELDWNSAAEWNKKGISSLENEISNIEDTDYKITLLLFLAEYHRLVAECLIWSGNIAEVNAELALAEEIYNQVSTRDRYYIRFLYTSAFSHLLTGDYKSTYDECCILFKQATSKYDKSQILFYQSIAALKLKEIEEAISCSKKAYNLAISIEAWLESEEIAVVASLAGNTDKKHQHLNNPFINKWIGYAQEFINKI